MRLQGVPLDRIHGAEGVVPPKGLVHSMVELGLLQPVLLYPEANGDYTVIFGRKRVAAARELGWETIQARLSPEDRALATLHENYHRSPSPALEARMMQALMETWGWSQRELAKHLGISQAQVSQRLALLSLTPEALDRLERGELRPSLARELMKLPPEEQASLLAEDSLPTLKQVQATRRQRTLAALADLPLPIMSPPGGNLLTPTTPPAGVPEEGFQSADFQERLEAEILTLDSPVEIRDQEGRPLLRLPPGRRYRILAIRSKKEEPLP